MYVVKQALLTTIWHRYTYFDHFFLSFWLINWNLSGVLANIITYVLGIECLFYASQPLNESQKNRNYNEKSKGIRMNETQHTMKNLNLTAKNYSSCPIRFNTT